MIEKIVDIARLAGHRIMEVYRSDDFDISIKKDKSPLTKADLSSHEYITEELKNSFEYPVLSEENPVDYPERKGWEKFWLVDPLDGTKDFIAKDDEFTVNIALIENDRPILGVVCIPALEIVYCAEQGKGAYKIKGGNKEKIFYQRKGELTCADSRFHSSEATLEFCRKYGIEEILRYGSALKLCKIAEGEIDVYPRFVGTMEWDTAAGHCILNESGCRLVDMITKTDLVYNKESLVNNGFIASSKNDNFMD